MRSRKRLQTSIVGATMNKHREKCIPPILLSKRLNFQIAVWCSFRKLIVYWLPSIACNGSMWPCIWLDRGKKSLEQGSSYIYLHLLYNYPYCGNNCHFLFYFTKVISVQLISLQWCQRKSLSPVVFGMKSFI